MFKLKNHKTKLIIAVFTIVLCFSVFYAVRHYQEKEVLNTALDSVITETVSKNDATQKEYSVQTFQDGKIENRQIITDGSEVAAMHDGYGNKTETRYFTDESGLTTLTIKTFADGYQEAIVFGENGVKKKIPAEMIGRVLTASSYEIARNLGIVKIKTDEPTIATVKTLEPNPIPQTQVIQPPISVTQPKENVAENKPESKSDELAKQPSNEQNPSTSREKIAQVAKVKETNN